MAACNLGHGYHLRSRGPINRCEICERAVLDNSRKRLLYTPPHARIIFENPERRYAENIEVYVERKIPNSFKTNQFKSLVVAADKLVDYYDRLWNSADYVIDLADEEFAIEAAKKRKIQNDNNLLLLKNHGSDVHLLNDGASTSKSVTIQNSGASTSNSDEMEKLDAYFRKYQSHQIFLYARHIQKHGMDEFITLKTTMCDDIFSGCFKRNVDSNRQFMHSFSLRGWQSNDIVGYIMETGKNPLYCNNLHDITDYVVKCNDKTLKPFSQKITIAPIHNKTPFSLKALCAPVVVKNLPKLNLDQLDTCFEIFNQCDQVYIACGQSEIRKVFEMQSVLLNAIVHRLCMYAKYKEKLVRKTKLYFRHLLENPTTFCPCCTRVNLVCNCCACKYLRERRYTANLEFNGHQITCDKIKNFYDKNNVRNVNDNLLVVANQSGLVFGPTQENV